MYFLNLMFKSIHFRPLDVNVTCEKEGGSYTQDSEIPVRIPNLPPTNKFHNLSLESTTSVN